MFCKDIITVIETTYPKHAALEWDNVGLLFGRRNKVVLTIFVALDATDEIIEEAIRQRADMLITHHPLVFSPLKQITDDDLVGKRLLRLSQYDIAYYAMHTNYDILRMAELAGEKLGLTNMEVLEVTDIEKGIGIGKVGALSQGMTVKACCELVKQAFQLDAVKVYGALDENVQRVAISPGSGKHMSEHAVCKHADVFITAEIDHHEGIDSVSEGMAIIDAGHYGLEHIFIEDIAAFLRKNLQDVAVKQANIRHPFQIV